MASGGRCLVHTRLVLDRARELIDDLPYAKQVTVMLGALAHDFGKHSTTEFLEGRWRSRGHRKLEFTGETFLDRFEHSYVGCYDVRAR